VSEEEHKDFSEQDVEQRFEAVGKTMVEQGLYAEAIEAYKELIREYPRSRGAANAYLAIAHCYHALGQEEDELAALEDIIRQFPDHVVAKRAQGAVAALRERRSGDAGAGADVHGALRRLTRQVERIRQGQSRRVWVGAVVYAALILFVVFYARGAVRSHDSAIADLGKRVAALESAVQALSSVPAGPQAARPSPASGSATKPGPAATVIPLAPPTESPSTPQPVAPAAKPPPKPAPTPGTASKPPPAPATKAVAARTYTVREGDSLWSIAKSQLGDGRKVDEIAALNGLTPPFTIKVGMKLKVPARQ
jgi:tetratricopeptide (TPR) repeat protein